MKHLYKSFIFPLILSILIAFAAPVYAADSTQPTRKIRVGYMNHPCFIEKRENGSFYGYGVEYLEDICNYTGWEIEYVYASWLDQLDMLESGELDIVPMAQYSDERAERFAYSNQPMGILQCLLLALPADQSNIEGNALACDGRLIGIQRGSRNIELLRIYAEHMGFDYGMVEYDYQSELEQALLDGDVDIIACEQMIEATGFRILDRFASDPYYFITAKDNTELIEELDYTISKLNAYDPTYTSKLYEKYFGDGLSAMTPYFSKKEMEFIDSGKEITVALLPDTRPEVYTDKNGELTGIFPDVMNIISELSGLKFNFEYIPQDKTPLGFLQENPTYIASGVVASNPAFESEDILLSEVYYTNDAAVAANKNRADKMSIDDATCVVGTTVSFQAIQLFISNNYPNATVACYSTIEENLQALEDYEIDFFVTPAQLINPYLANPRYGDVIISDRHFMEGPRCTLALRSPENEIIMGIINKCIPFISDDELAHIESEHLQQSVYQFDKEDVFHRYRDILLLVSLIFVGAIALLLLLLFIRQYRYNRQITLHAEYDIMTGIYNRATMQEKAEQLLGNNTGRGCVLLVIDIDNLKRINDLRGHNVGDLTIKDTAAAMKHLFRNNTVIGRIGGDEFAALLIGIESKSAAIPLLTRLQKELSTTVVADGMTLLSGSIGVAMGKAGEISLDELFRRADEALARVKADGRNGFAFYESKKTISLRDTETEQDRQVPSLPTVDEYPVLTDSELSLEQTDSNFKMLFDSFPNLAVYVIERSTHRVIFYNKRFKELCPKVKLGISCRSIQFGPCQSCIVDSMGEQRMAHSLYYSEYFGDEIEITATKIMWDDRIPAVMISSWPRNVLTSSNENLPGVSNQNAFDYVTGGMTRSGFIRMMERMQKGGVDLTDYAILFINIKDFKAVNEMVGSEGGDNLLFTFFERVEKSKLNPVIGSRKESDHFIFMVEKSVLELSSLPELLNFHWQYDSKDLYIHCRCGVFYIDDNDLEIYKMIDRAKLAKEHIVDDYTQPYAVYNRSMLEEYSEMTSAFLMFDKGIRNKEFVVYYQPVTDAKTGAVVSAEALVRKISSDGKIISPAKFVPILERTGYISMLDLFVAKEVGAFLRQRLEKGKPCVPISFNISQKDFYDLEEIVSGIENSTLPKGYLMMEITESAYTIHEKKHEDYLKRLRAAGAKILLDDFGTGYSSFGMFENYNFDRVKLDMSFVHQLCSNENVRMVVGSIISMCHKLGVQVVAEGVETQEQLAILRELDCDFIQGYYYSKPLCEADFIKYLKEHLN